MNPHTRIAASRPVNYNLPIHRMSPIRKDLYAYLRNVGHLSFDMLRQKGFMEEARRMIRQGVIASDDSNVWLHWS